MVMVSASHWATWSPERSTEHLGEDVVWISWKSSTLWPVRCPELVEVLTLLRIAQDLIGLLDLFKLLRVTAFVRVVLSGKFAIGLFDVVMGRIF
jgi:hypothetical protein